MTGQATTTEMAEQDWVSRELATLKLADKRLEQRAELIVRAMITNPSGSIPEFTGDQHAAKAVYRFMHNPKSDVNAILSSQRQATLGRIKGSELVLCVQDTSEIDLSRYPSIEGKGRLPRGKGNRTGTLVHTTMAVSQNGVPLGIMAQHTWTRPLEPEEKPTKAVERAIEEKESWKWLQGIIDSTRDGVPEDTRLVFVSDRESDVMEYYLRAETCEVDVLARATQNRRLVGSTNLLFETLAEAPLATVFHVNVSRKGRLPARTATCELRYRSVTLRPPNSNRRGAANKLGPVTLNAILVREVNAPYDETPLRWLLLTSLEVSTVEQALEVVYFYTLRWLVERFHYTLKSGCAIEKRRLESVDAIHRMLALSNIVAWRLLWLTYQMRKHPLQPCTVAFSAVEWQILFLLTHRKRADPARPPTLHDTTLWLAKLGGFLARKGDGAPGVKVLWRGMQKLSSQVELWHALFATADETASEVVHFPEAGPLETDFDRLSLLKSCTYG